MNYSYFSYTRVIAVVALFAGAILLWPGKLYFLNDDFLHLHLSGKGEWLQRNSLRPFCDFSMWIDYQLWGMNAMGFHLTNAILHITCTLLVYKFSLKLLERFHQSAVAGSNAILIASVFFVYAFHSETIYWVIGRSASLGAIWFLLSLICYLKRHSGKQFLFSILFFVGGLFTYESVWITPLVFALISWLDVKNNHQNKQAEVKFIITSVVVLLVYFVIRYLLIQQIIAVYEAERFLTFDIRGLTLNYIKLLLRSFSRQSGNFYLLGIAFLIGITALISFLITRRRMLAASLLFIWLLTYIPYLSLGIDTFGSEGERFLYLPSIFLSIIIGLGIVNAARVYKYVISLLFFFVHILLLYDNRRSYEVASAVTESTVRAMKSLKGKKNIYVIQLPHENNGAVIFRDGIEAAAKLAGIEDRNIRIVSTYHGNYTFFNGVSEQDWNNELPGSEGEDAVLDFSNSSLTIYH